MVTHTLREGELAQARFLGGHAREALLTGLAGVVVFSWTDEWHIGGFAVKDWEFGITCADRSPKASYHALREVFQGTPAALLAHTQQRLLLLDTWQRSGLPAGDFAALVGLSKHTLYVWKRKFDAEGPGAGVQRVLRGVFEAICPCRWRKKIGEHAFVVDTMPKGAKMAPASAQHQTGSQHITRLRRPDGA